jgi:hypothetical protein
MTSFSFAVYTVYVPHFCSAPSSSPLCSCGLAGMATSQHCSPSQPIAIRNNVAEGQWLSSSSFTKKDGSKWSSFYKLSKEDGSGTWRWESNSTGEFHLGGGGAPAKPKPKAAKPAKSGPLTECPPNTYLGASGNCISKTKCADGTYCSKGRIGSPAPAP